MFGFVVHSNKQSRDLVACGQLSQLIIGALTELTFKITLAIRCTVQCAPSENVPGRYSCDLGGGVRGRGFNVPCRPYYVPRIDRIIHAP